jgi:V8-like Glu-specific endopeptidase
MVAPGHRPVRSDAPQSETRRLLEAAAPVTNRASLPYYRPPKRRRRLVNESFVEAGELGESNVALPDVAVASFGDTPLLEAVLGNDDRVKVAGSVLSSNPWRQICALRIRSQSNQLYVGTGWFIGPKTLATAGHCVYLQDDGGWAKSIDVIPARFGSSEPFGTIRSTRFSAVDGWTVQSQRDFDYGVIHLDSDAAGLQTGNFEVRSFSDALLNNVGAKISGYPADREQAQFQYFHERPIQRVSATRLFYDIDTFGGQSGSPIWEDTEENGVIAIGIHTTGGVSSNSGTRISDDVIDNLISWLEA